MPVIVSTNGGKLGSNVWRAMTGYGGWVGLDSYPVLADNEKDINFR